LVGFKVSLKWGWTSLNGVLKHALCLYKMISPQKSKGIYIYIYSCQISAKNYKVQLIEKKTYNLLKCNMVFRIELWKYIYNSFNLSITC